jgi:GNAT superfamily N-acetyltransferase
MPEVAVEAFEASKHKRDGFSCGEPSLDAFLQKLVSQYDKRRLGKTYVAVDPESRVVGYYTLSSSSIPFAKIPHDRKKLPKHPVPAILLGRLAVDQSERGRGLGRLLLVNALRRSWEVSRTIGAYAVEVHALSDQAAQFYEKYGFARLVDSPNHLLLPMKTIDQLMTPAG